MTALLQRACTSLVDKRVSRGHSRVCLCHDVNFINLTFPFTFVYLGLLGGVAAIARCGLILQMR